MIKLNRWQLGLLVFFLLATAVTNAAFIYTVATGMTMYVEQPTISAVMTGLFAGIAVTGIAATGLLGWGLYKYSLRNRTPKIGAPKLMSRKL